MGELSSARQALEGTSLAPGTLATLGILTDPNRRPRVPRVHERGVQHAAPARLFELDAEEFLTNLRKARRGAAPATSGMTSDHHLFPVLGSPGVSELLVQVASHLAVGRVSEEIIEVTMLGRLTALSKPDGGVREIVVGDILRRMVARTMAKQINKKVEAPFQYALSTKAACECVAHIFQTVTDLRSLPLTGLGRTT